MGQVLVRRLKELSQIQDGWLNGEGLKPSELALEIAHPLATKLSDMGLFPTLSGGLSFECPDFEIQISSCGISQITITESMEGSDG